MTSQFKRWADNVFYLSGHPHFFNQLYSAVSGYGIAGSWLTDALNTNMYVTSALKEKARFTTYLMF